MTNPRTIRCVAPVRRGAALVWVAVFMALFLGLLGLGIDTGYVMLTAHQLQNGADASALASAALVKGDQTLARQKAVDLGLLNHAAGETIKIDPNDANAVDGDVVLGVYERDTRTFTPNSDNPNAVKVVARREDGHTAGSLPLFFGPVFGVSSADVARHAIAISSGGTGAGLITLNNTGDCSLRMNGTNELTVQNAAGYEGEAGIQVNSSDPCAMCTSGSSLTIEAPEINLVGDICSNGSPEINSDINPGSPYMSDPLADMPAPSPGPDLGSITTGGTHGPGYYSGGIRNTASGQTITLDPGVYYLDGEGLYINGGNLIAHEVMFYIAGTGSLYLGGNGTIEITPISDEAHPYWGVSIFQARDNANPSTIIGTSDMDLEGTFYFPIAELEIGGNGIALGNQLIAWDMWIHGTGEFTINYDGRFPSPGGRVFLVE